MSPSNLRVYRQRLDQHHKFNVLNIRLRSRRKASNSFEIAIFSILLFTFRKDTRHRMEKLTKNKLAIFLNV